MEKLLRKTVVFAGLALLCCLLWGSAFPFIKVGYELMDITDTGSKILYGGYRFFCAGGIIFVMGSVTERRLLKLDSRIVPAVLGIGTFQIAIQYMFFYVGLSNITGSKGSLINACQGFVSIAAAHFLLKSEKMTWRKCVGCLIGLLGIVIINLDSETGAGGFIFQGDGFIIIATVLYGVGSVFIKMISHRDTPMCITAYQLLSGGFIMIIAGIAAGGHLGSFTLKSFAVLAYLTLISAVAFSLWNMLIKYRSVGKVAIFGSSIPIFASLLSGILLGEEIFTLQNLAALVCVCGGIIMVNQVPGRRLITEKMKEEKE